MLGTDITLYMTLGLLVVGAFERAWHQRALSTLAVRIHVNGTRGKSSVTRLIAAGLRESGLPTCAKTTGTLARFILPDGREEPIVRAGRPNISEQMKVVSRAQQLGAKALVIECMALRPSLQAASEQHLVQATHGVITNVRPDHLDVMGPQIEDVARALCGMVPKRGQMFTAERQLTSIIDMACQDRGASLRVVGPAASDAVAAADLARFGYTEHPDNVALALAVLETLGVDRRTALQGMWQATPDPGALSACSVAWAGRHVRFVNGFAANDPQSTEFIWRQATQAHPHCRKHVALFNCRGDRQERSVQLGAALPHWPLPDCVVLMGGGAAPFVRATLKAGFDPGRLLVLGDLPAAELYVCLMELVEDSALIMGLGNIGGAALALAHYFQQRSVSGATQDTAP